MDGIHETSPTRFTPPAQQPTPEDKSGPAVQPTSQQTVPATNQTIGATSERPMGESSKAGKADAAREWARRMKPFAMAAESFTARVVDLSARGLTRLSETLNERQQRRKVESSGEDRPLDS